MNINLINMKYNIILISFLILLGAMFMAENQYIISLVVFYYTIDHIRDVVKQVINTQTIVLYN